MKAGEVFRIGCVLILGACAFSPQPLAQASNIPADMVPRGYTAAECRWVGDPDNKGGYSPALVVQEGTGPGGWRGIACVHRSTPASVRGSI